MKVRITNQLDAQNQCGNCKDLIVTEDVKEKNHHAPFDGPNKLIKELKDNKEWEVFNLFNNGILREKPSSTGITLVQKCRV